MRSLCSAPGISTLLLLSAFMHIPTVCSRHSVQSDPTLSFINSALASRSEPLSVGSGDRGGSEALAQWEVQWPELTILRVIGKGGWVGGEGVSLHRLALTFPLSCSGQARLALFTWRNGAASMSQSRFSSTLVSRCRL